jgi:uncharacterized protein YuzE
MSNIKLSVDKDNDLAYITLSDHAVARTVEHNECVNVDLDDMAIAVGIELLDLDAKIPFTELNTNYHVSSEVVELLRRIQPTINKFVFSYKSTDEPASVHADAAAVV